VFYQEPKKKYNEVPAYSVSEMNGDEELEFCGNSIEGALCAYDIENKEQLSDQDAIRIIELLIDKYHFRDQQLDLEDRLIVDGVNYVDRSMRDDLRGLATEEIVKVLELIRFVARRRTKTGREYMTVIHRFVGRRIAPGIRVMRQ
jgi:hypothetical protein